MITKEKIGDETHLYVNPGLISNPDHITKNNEPIHYEENERYSNPNLDFYEKAVAEKDKENINRKEFEVVILGDKGVGKTSILDRAIKDEFN